MPYLDLFADFVAELGTAAYDFKQLSQREKLKTGGVGASVDSRVSLDGTERPSLYLALTAHALDRNVPAMFDLLTEVATSARWASEPERRAEPATNARHIEPEADEARDASAARIATREGGRGEEGRRGGEGRARRAREGVPARWRSTGRKTRRRASSDRGFGAKRPRELGRSGGRRFRRELCQ